MTRELTATEVEARILELLDDVAAGDEIEITKHDRTIARLVAATGSPALKRSFSGVAMSATADDELFVTAQHGICRDDRSPRPSP
jgi:antitoxin (DNA-binding transcriptional repressor) of toxin-antitoxin stability system